MSDYINQSCGCGCAPRSQRQNSRMHNRCGCQQSIQCKPEILPVMAFIVFQPEISEQDMYKPETALQRGTLFIGLDKPFWAAEGGCKR